MTTIPHTIQVNPHLQLLPTTFSTKLEAFLVKLKPKGVRRLLRGKPKWRALYKFLKTFQRYPMKWPEIVKGKSQDTWEDREWKRVNRYYADQEILNHYAFGLPVVNHQAKAIIMQQRGARILSKIPRAVSYVAGNKNKQKRLRKAKPKYETVYP